MRAASSINYFPQVGHLSAAGADLAAPAALNFGRPKPTIEIISPALFFLKARSFLET